MGGVFEMEAFAKGTNDVAATLAEITKTGACTIIGGGDSVAAVEAAGLADRCRTSPQAVALPSNSLKERCSQVLLLLLKLKYRAYPVADSVGLSYILDSLQRTVAESSAARQEGRRRQSRRASPTGQAYKRRPQDQRGTRGRLSCLLF